MRLIDVCDSFTLNDCNGVGFSLAFGGGFIDVYDPMGNHDCQFWAGGAPTIDPESLRKKGEWISVEDMLPTRDGRYICCYVFGNENRQFFGVLDYYSCDQIPHFQHELGGYGMRVTHWMPLPEPPTTNEVASDIMMQAQED